MVALRKERPEFADECVVMSGERGIPEGGNDRQWQLKEERRLRREASLLMRQIKVVDDDDRLSSVVELLGFIVEAQDKDLDGDDVSFAMSLFLKLVAEHRAPNQRRPMFNAKRPGAQRMTVTVDTTALWSGQAHPLPWLVDQRDFYVSGTAALNVVHAIAALAMPRRFSDGAILEGEAARLVAGRNWQKTPGEDDLAHLMDVFRATRGVHCCDCSHIAFVHQGGRCSEIGCECQLSQRAVVEALSS